MFALFAIRFLLDLGLKDTRQVLYAEGIEGLGLPELVCGLESSISVAAATMSISVSRACQSWTLDSSSYILGSALCLKSSSLPSEQSRIFSVSIAPCFW